MFKLLKTIAKAGESTAKYPFAPYPVSDDFRGKPEYQPKQCISCAACTRACPANALIMETNTADNSRRWQLSLARCIYCGRCEEVCPTGAIKLSQDFELAVGNKADLYQEAVFELSSCVQCGVAFAPQKAVKYALDLLVQAGLPTEQLESRTQQLNTCPECRRKANMLEGDGLMQRNTMSQETVNERN
ncbi:formate hydrogenlyase complex iron-sulfur subunit [Paraferrimonas sedimenticola]|uniref:Hydrogenase 4 subunit H n=1 Tax=Paraferrimonas sedimenticola TaxID=375674 RepID=A0AA37RZC7_9GAMM|nr:formate hydrogenlyase complex iron-sulfur subunit [Paraferrimonas sedimenticola]GLP97312.1 hydrogenase 4 subunit H [Paraferrimonas sedimenticola]